MNKIETSKAVLATMRLFRFIFLAGAILYELLLLANRQLMLVALTLEDRIGIVCLQIPTTLKLQEKDCSR